MTGDGHTDIPDTRTADRARFQRIEELFRNARQLPIDQRDAYLDQHCADEPSIHEQVHRMLQADDEPAGVLDQPAFGPDIRLSDVPIDSTDDLHPTPEQIGRYRIIRVIGEGGMGIVYEAEQENPRRRVALKVLRQRATAPRILRRFQQEVHILGRLQHPGIAQILEAGTTETDQGTQPFFVMEFVHGKPLLEYADDNNLSTRNRLELMANISDAVHFAHQHGIVHRDLKPSNILVTDESTKSTKSTSATSRLDSTHSQTSSAQPKILDFGVARLADPDMQTVTLQTTVGELIGTVPYMSPEQAAGDPTDLDWRSDVYTLGVILYELLTGQLPQNLRTLMVHEAVRTIREEEPTPAGSINRSLRGDVETILAKALEKDKARRYQSAADFAADIRRHLHVEPIAARPPSAIYRIRKFSRRNKAIVVGVAATFIVLVAGLIGTTTMYVRAEAAREDFAEQHSIATREAERALAAEKETEQRADDLTKVVAFQASQLTDINIELMGARIRDGIIERQRANLFDDGSDQDEVERALSTLRDALAGVNFTSIALESLETNLIDRSIEAIHEQFADQPTVKAELLHTVARTMIALGLHNQAEEPLTEALELQRSNLGDDHADTLSTIDAMGLLRESQDQLEKAEQLYREAMDERRRTLGPEHPDTLKSINNLGLLLNRQGRFAESEDHLRAVLEARRRVFGDESLETLNSINNLGILFLDQGKLAEAEKYHREAVAGYQKILGDSDPQTLTSSNNLGWLLQMRGKFTEAEPYVRQAMNGRRRVLGNEHPATLRSINNMGVLLQSQGKFDEAEPFYREALERRRHVLGETHTDTLISIGSLGTLLAQQGRLREAEPYLRNSLEGFRRALGPHHPTTLRSTTHLMRLLKELDRHSDASQLGAQAVRDAREGLRDGHHLIGELLHGHAQALTALTRYAEAERNLLEAHEILVASYGSAHLITQRVANDLAKLYDALHEAEPDAGHDAAAQKWRATLPENDVDK